MRQATLASVGLERYGKTPRRAAFLAEMERVVPWPALCGLIEPFYPKPGNGRPPVGIERMLRIYFLQQWFNLSDPAVEEALYDSLAQLRRFEHLRTPKWLRLLRPTPKGRHYSGIGGTGAAVILGGGWAGRSSFGFVS